MYDTKILIESKRSKKAYVKSLLCIALVSCIFSFLAAYVITSRIEFRGLFLQFGLCILFIALPTMAISYCILGTVYDHVSIVVTADAVKCVCGLKEVHLPVSAISSVTRNAALFNTLGLNCAGKTYKLLYIENLDAVFHVINRLLTEESAGAK